MKFLITRSELDQMWFNKLKKAKLDFLGLLYISRIKKEKGIYSLLNLTKDFNFKFKLSIVGGINSNMPKDKNFEIIKNDMNKNILPTKKSFQKELLNILNV